MAGTDGHGKRLARAYSDGYKTGRGDRARGIRSTYAYYSNSEALPHDPVSQAYSAGYRDGWKGLPSNEAEYA